MTIALPEGYTSVEDALPKDDHPVLAIRESGYLSCEFEIITAMYRPDYRPKSPWRDITGDSVNDTGSGILGWAYADELLKPTGDKRAFA
ncbi:hypothetical protein [Erythrobacter aureus]|uniref:Uncharacterized protein n=1 Tax=Erythrobacter aureus TaxID=2182384 RepID=A0A345YIS4_9SPHN|nr:hypothetical protein [Erythrobacter aureus]AXK43826.1 hypothetical protein DVR09_15330 [Erythrobacter aureus]